MPLRTHPHTTRNVKRNAFTLLELIVVIVILGVLAAVAIPTFARVIQTSKLETAETTAGAYAREVLALAGFDGGTITRDHIDAAARDLQVSAAPGTLAADDEGAIVRHGQWEHSTGARYISVRLSSAAVPVMGVAIWVPDAGCAFARTGGGSTQVRTWHVADDQIEMVNCNGNVAITETDPSTLKAPRMPSVWIGANPITCPDGTWWTWDGSETVDIYVNGEWVASGSGGYCGTPDDKVVVVERGPGGPASGPAGWEGGAGNLLTDDSSEIPGPQVPGTIKVTAPTPVVVTHPDERGGEVWRRPAEGGPAIHVGTIPEEGRRAHYETVPPGEWIYEIRDGNGGTSPGRVEEAQPAHPVDSGRAAAAVLSDGSIRISWGLLPDDPIAPVDGYRLYRATSVDGPWTAMHRQMDAFTDTTLDEQPGNGTWCYRLSAFGPGGESEKTTPICVTIQLAPKPPTAVKDLTATAGSGEVALAWRMPETFGSPVAEYTVTVTPATGVTGATTRTTTTPGLVFDGLSNYVSYTFTVTATTANGTSPAVSAEARPVGAPAGCMPAPAQLGGCLLTNGGADSHTGTATAAIDGNLSTAWVHADWNGTGWIVAAPEAPTGFTRLHLAVSSSQTGTVAFNFVGTRLTPWGAWLASSRMPFTVEVEAGATTFVTIPVPPELYMSINLETYKVNGTELRIQEIAIS